ncbi:MAG: peptidase M17 [Planctomycetota bacterium]
MSNKKSPPPRGWSRLSKAKAKKLALAADTAIRKVLRVKREERVLIITNPEEDVLAISGALFDAAERCGADACVVVQPTRAPLHMASEAVIHALRSEPEVIISISADKLGKDPYGLVKPYRFKGAKGSWSHIFNALLGTGKSRAFWSPSVTLDTFIRTVPIDYTLLRRRAAKIKKRLDTAERVHITAPGGTDIEIGLQGRVATTDDGAFWEPGSGGNLPAGETYISPANYDGEGVLVFDGSMSLADGSGAFVPSEPVFAEIKKGRVIRLRGGVDAKRFGKSLALGEMFAQDMAGQGGWNAKKVKSYKHNAKHLGELGIGLNPAARVTGKMLEDEKIMNTCHIAIGSNYDNDAEAFIHLDCLIKKPSIRVIDAKGRSRLILEEGRIL